MRLAPGERQSGDGTSLPETPNNLTNVSNEIADCRFLIMENYPVKYHPFLEIKIKIHYGVQYTLDLTTFECLVICNFLMYCVDYKSVV